MYTFSIYEFVYVSARGYVSVVLPGHELITDRMDEFVRSPEGFALASDRVSPSRLKRPVEPRLKCCSFTFPPHTERWTQPTHSTLR